nr:MAG: hypothetical protein J07AB56_12550 [Candidatus Nanosalinarum sp. J07AB56]
MQDPLKPAFKISRGTAGAMMFVVGVLELLFTAYVL